MKVYEAGELTVIGFGGAAVLDDVNLAQCRDEIAELIRVHGCQTLAFDLTGVLLVPSGLLGVLASVKRLGVEIHLYNASEDIREALEITKLDKTFHLHRVAV